MQAFEDCINATACKAAPWAVIPADDKLNMRLIVTSIVLQELRKLKLKTPPASERLADEMEDIKARLKAQKP